MGTTLGRFGAAHQRAHRYLPACLHTQEHSKTGAENDIYDLSLVQKLHRRDSARAPTQLVDPER